MRWLESGKPVEETRTIDVSANCISRVEFTKPARPSSEPHRGNLKDAAFSPDGKLLATATTGSGNWITLWNPATLRRLGAFQGRQPLAFSPDSKLLAGCGEDKSIRIWEVSSLEQVRRLPAPDYASCLAFAPGVGT